MAFILGSPMIFVDEVDGIHGRGDYGGAEALIQILKEPTIPIILAANNDTSDKMKSIKKVVKTILFKPIPPRLLRVYLENILEKENRVKNVFCNKKISILGGLIFTPPGCIQLVKVVTETVRYAIDCYLRA